MYELWHLFFHSEQIHTDMAAAHFTRLLQMYIKETGTRKRAHWAVASFVLTIGLSVTQHQWLMGFTVLLHVLSVLEFCETGRPCSVTAYRELFTKQEYIKSLMPKCHKEMSLIFFKSKTKQKKKSVFLHSLDVETSTCWSCKIILSVMDWYIFVKTALTLHTLFYSLCSEMPINPVPTNYKLNRH